MNVLRERYEVELEFVSATVDYQITLDVDTNDDVIVEAARTEVVDERNDLGQFKAGRVVG